MSASIELYFSTAHTPILERVRFNYPGISDTRLSVRGKDGGAFKGASAFQWTPAVRALSGLCIRAAIARDDHGAVLVGGKDTPASSLDYAISKLPCWLMDMFGVNSVGVPLARYLLQRTNPERKRGGEVAIRLRHTLLPSDGISIFENGVRVLSPHRLLEIASVVLEEKRLSRSPVEIPFSTQPSPEEIFDSTVCKLMEREVITVLDETDVFHPRHYADVLSKVAENQAFISLGGRGELLRSLPERVGRGSIRLGAPNPRDVDNFGEKLKRPLRVALAVGMDGPHVVLSSLKRMYGVELTVDWGFSYASEVVSALESGDRPDACVLCLASAASLMGARAGNDYIPLMLLPKTSHRVVAPRSSARETKVGEGNFYLVQSVPTVSSLFLEQLRQNGVVSARRSTSTHADTVDIASVLTDGGPDDRAILWYPFYSLAELFLGARVMHQVPTDSANVGSILFLHRDLMDDRRWATTFEAMLRDSWLTLREDRNCMRAVVQEIACMNSYTKFMRRVAGLSLRNLTGAGDRLCTQ